MRRLLIADRRKEEVSRLVRTLRDTDLEFVVPDTVEDLLREILKNEARVVLLGSDLDGFSPAKLVTLMNKCDRGVQIILLFDEMSLESLRKMREEGIFYQLAQPWDEEELRLAIKCAFSKVQVEDRTKIRRILTNPIA